MFIKQLLFQHWRHNFFDKLWFWYRLVVPGKAFALALPIAAKLFTKKVCILGFSLFCQTIVFLYFFAFYFITLSQFM